MNIRQTLKVHWLPQLWFIQECKKYGIGMNYQKIRRIDTGETELKVSEHEVVKKILEKLEK